MEVWAEKSVRLLIKPVSQSCCSIYDQLMKWMPVLLAGSVFQMIYTADAGESASVTIAQISDTHLGEKHSPKAAENLQKSIEMINERHPDAVVISGDLGERPENREETLKILKSLKAPFYCVPGNHDLHDAAGLARYRKIFGRDYFRFQVKSVEVLAIDSQLLGNYQKFEGTNIPPLIEELKPESDKMLAWLREQESVTKGKVTIALQHIPLYRDGNFPDGKPYWTVNEPYVREEAEILKGLGVGHMLAGHWHHGRVFEHAGFTIHVAPATSWLPLKGKLGFAWHTISLDGQVNTEFIFLPVENQPSPTKEAPPR